MAKALKRELGVTAKEIRKTYTEGTPEETARIFEMLEHPSQGMSVERKLAKDLPCEVIWYPERWINTDKVPDLGWDDLCIKYGKKVTKVVSMTKISDLEKAWKDIRYFVGENCENAKHGNQAIPEGHYLCCEVYLVSDAAYAAAIEGLFAKSAEMGLEIEDGYLIELIRDVELTLTGGAVFSFQIPIKE
ncbi:hypothetical protein [Vibrio sonorensis]|uniref:hypothetical protein n=1 Tax=Vibrio sonorensis TaxID=1004316 RepID=UPI001FDFE323|nr:hypothetical protein [Vibrio sonorensis]